MPTFEDVRHQFKIGSKFKLQIPDLLEKEVASVIDQKHLYPIWFYEAKRINGQIVTIQNTPSPQCTYNNLIFATLSETNYGVPISWLKPFDFQPGTKYRFVLPDKMPEWFFDRDPAWRREILKLNSQPITILEFYKDGPWASGCSSSHARIQESKWQIPTEWLVHIAYFSENSDMPELVVSSYPKSDLPQLNHFLKIVQDELSIVREERNRIREECISLRSKLGKIQSDLDSAINDRFELFQENKSLKSNLGVLNQEIYNVLSQVTDANTKLIDTEGQLSLTQAALDLERLKVHQIQTQNCDAFPFRIFCQLGKFSLTSSLALLKGLEIVGKKIHFLALNSGSKIYGFLAKVSTFLKDDWEQTEILDHCTPLVFLGLVALALAASPILSEAKRLEAEAAPENQPLIIRTDSKIFPLTLINNDGRRIIFTTK